MMVDLSKYAKIANINIDRYLVNNNINRLNYLYY